MWSGKYQHTANCKPYLSSQQRNVYGTGIGYGRDANLGFDGTGAADIYYYNYYAGDIEHANRANGVWNNSSITGGGTLLDEALGAQGQKTLSWISGGGAVVGDL